MSKKKTKKLPDAPRASYTLRDLDKIPEGRWPVPENTRLRMNRRVSIGMPEEMREAWDEAKAKTGRSLSDLGRGLSKGLASFRPKGL